MWPFRLIAQVAQVAQVSLTRLRLVRGLPELRRRRFEDRTAVFHGGRKLYDLLVSGTQDGQDGQGAPRCTKVHFVTKIHVD